jgi:hypothetical protein
MHRISEFTVYNKPHKNRRHTDFLKVSTFQANEDFPDETRLVLLSEESNGISNVFQIPSFRTNTDILDETQFVMRNRVNGLKNL